MNKKLFLTALSSLLLISLSFSSFATNFSPERLRYVITYKWGLIHKEAGEATMSLKQSNGHYDIILTARTKPWADKIFMVRDTLRSRILIDSFKPVSYTKIAHEGGKYGKDEIEYSYRGKNVIGKCTRYKEKKGKVSQSVKSLNGSGKVFDMLSIFYYLRIIDYSSLLKDKPISTTIFSGSKVETLTIKYLGEEMVEMRNKTKRKAYHIVFKFTTDGKKESSADMNAWISTDNRHIPLLLTGQLPVGQVKCYYIG